MKEFKELFVKHLTKDVNPEYASAIFNSETGSQLWDETRLDMILQAFDAAEKEFLLQQN